MERGIVPGLLPDKIEEVPLRHERQELAVRWQLREVGKCHGSIPKLCVQQASFLMGQFEETLQHPEFIHNFES